MKKLFTFLAITGFCFSSFAQNVGETAPDFTLETLNNQSYTLSDNRGDVMLVFLVGYNCPLCIASAPTVKIQILDEFISNGNFQSVIIDTWNGSASAVQNFQSSTGLPGVYLQQGSGVASSWSTTYDRLVVIDADGVMVFKGSSAASSDASEAKQAVQQALNKLVTSAGDLERNNTFWVEQNYPNPFTVKTRIEFNLPEPENVSLEITDLSGKTISRRVERFFPAGINSIDLKRNNLKNGFYFYHLRAGGYSYSGKMMVY